jgi:hypothetical protein
MSFKYDTTKEKVIKWRKYRDDNVTVIKFLKIMSNKNNKYYYIMVTICILLTFIQDFIYLFVILYLHHLIKKIEIV